MVSRNTCVRRPCVRACVRVCVRACVRACGTLINLLKTHLNCFYCVLRLFNAQDSDPQ